MTTTALLVMDYQNGLLPRVQDPETLLATAAHTIDAVRAAGGHVGYVRVGFADGEPPMGGRSNLHADAPETQIHDAVAPREGDIVVRKTRVGPFTTTDLDTQLRARGVDTLLLAGISTSGVVLSTVREAFDRDYRLTVISDLCADPDREVHDFLIERIFPRQAEIATAATAAGPGC